MAGDSLRLPVRHFLEAIERGPALRRAVHRDVAYSPRVASQGIACNAPHPVESRASRWLLMWHDQARADEFPMTREFVALMLDVFRPTVTAVAGAFQDAGLIGYRRGAITIRHRDGLEDAACECPATVKCNYNRINS